jgi:DNA polymerase-2
MPRANPSQLRGWLLDVYADEQDGTVIWFIGEDGQRYRLTQYFPITFYLSGAAEQLRAAWKYLRRSWPQLHLSKQSRKELFDGPIDVLAVQVEQAILQPRVFYRLHERFPGLDYYNANLSLPMLYHAQYDVFPLAYCQIQINENLEVQDVQSLDDRWKLRTEIPRLRILKIYPDTDPSLADPQILQVVKGEDEQAVLNIKDPVQLLQRLQSIVDSYDPDVIASSYGDKWLFPFLFGKSEETGIPFNLNRDKQRAPIQIKENTFTSYGRVVHRDRQTLLLGRVHVDPENSMAILDTTLDSIVEQAKITTLPLQNIARRSTGGGFTAMQIREALRKDILIPLNKKQRERYQSAAEMIVADNGGVIFQPVTGLHFHVAEIDFFSMYPSLMSRWNISPETVGVRGENTYMVPGINRPISQDEEGVVPAILKPVLEKRKIAKRKLRHGDHKPSEKAYLEAMNDSLKSLGWVSYGYQGFRGNRIGNIEAHEAINAQSRELILRAKEAAEDMGYAVLHMYVDSLFVVKEGRKHKEHFYRLLGEMKQRTELQLDLAGVFRWIAFLPSKQDANLPVPNCFFGVFEDGKLKCRGIMARRDDTPRYIKQTQMDAIKLLAEETDAERLREHLPRLVHFLRRRFHRLMSGKVPEKRLVIAQRLSKDLDDYRVHSAGARAALQLRQAGKHLGAGQRANYLRTQDESGVLAWDLALAGQKVAIDYAWYAEAFRRAAFELLQPFGIEKQSTEVWLGAGPGYFQPEDYVGQGAKDLPLFEHAKQKGL